MQPSAKPVDAPILAVEGLTLTHAFLPRPSLENLSLGLALGERALLLGPSGCGKTSLALCLNAIIPRAIPASVAGRIDVAGEPVSSRQTGDWAEVIAYVFQDPESQLCALTVEEEIAFALENRSLPPAEIDRRIDATLTQVGLPVGWRRRASRHMSGGEKQKLLLAAALAQDASIYVFDETTSHLDPTSTAEAYRLIERMLALRRDRSALFIDHRLDCLLPMIDRVHLLDGTGHLVASESPARLFHDRRAEVAATGSWQPLAAELFGFLRSSGVELAERPRAMAEVPPILDSALRRSTKSEQTRILALLGQWLSAARPTATKAGGGAAVLEAEGVGYAPRGGPPIVTGISLRLHGGEILGLVGANGAGKSTLGLILAGLLKPSAGVLRRADSGMSGSFLFQNPEHQFVSTTVAGEVAESLFADGRLDLTDAKIATALDGIGLGSKRDLHPFQLSQGEKRRLSMLAVALAPARPVLVLDEPSFGLDARGTARLVEQICAIRRSGQALVLITHDMDLAARLSDRLAVMAHGTIISFGPPDRIFADPQLLAAADLAPPTAQPLADWLDAQPP